jgi:hypoxanthine phosphoribosyltransferase
MEKITIKDKEFQLFIPYSKIHTAIRQIASYISRDFEKKETPVFLSILNGAFMFTADLFKELTIDGYLSFVKFASYQGTASSEEVKELIGIHEDLQDKNVVILEDIVDTGLTIIKIAEQVKALQPRELKIATLLLKPAVFDGNIQPDYIGMEIPNDFIIGYGLDYRGLGRNYKDLYRLMEA